MPNYWAYWILGDQGWEYSAIGAGQSKIIDGGVYAWTWGTGNAPAVVSFENICLGVASVLPTTTPTSIPATITSQPSPVATLAPTQVPIQPVITPAPTGTSTGTYVIYAVILLVLGVLIILLIRIRSR
jgi:hypothetical protein